MRQLTDYHDRYRNARLTRSGSGVLEVVLHSDGGPLVWEESAHRELPLLFADIGADPGNRVVVLTGTGDAFCAEVSWAVWGDEDPSAVWDKLYVEGKRLLENLLSIEVPVIGAVNGPARFHAELVALSDAVLVAETATFQDAGHLKNGIVPGDGVHTAWLTLLGPNRGRYFLLTAEEIDAAQALRLGVAQEVLTPDRLRDRALELAEQLARNSTLALRGTRAALIHRIRRQMVDELGYGLMLEARAAVAGSHPSSKDWTGTEHLPKL
jgi:enoyl-CoA hydratase/carnithine racemase